VGAALDREAPSDAAERLDRLLGVLGPRHLAVELQVHLDARQDR